MMIEKAITIGEPGSALVGIWTEPLSSKETPERPAVIIINSGIVHHVGVWRLHTRAARALADRGFASLRFDLSGVGDSDNPTEGGPLGEIALRDLASAVEYVRQVRGRSRAVLMGLCSGGRDALEAADRHEGVVGAVVIDLLADFRTWRHHVAHFGPRLLRLESWKNTLSLTNGRLGAMGQMLRGDGEPDAAQIGASGATGVRSDLGRSQLDALLTRLLKRELKIFMAFSNGLEANYNHRGQFAEALPTVAANAGTSVNFYEEADHTFTDRAQQRRLLSDIVEWVELHFGS